LKAPVWTKEVLDSKLQNILDIHNSHKSSNETRIRENEAVYRSDFYTSWTNQGLVSKNLFESVDPKMNNWLVKASMNHTFTFIRLLHSILLTNEPVTTVSPSDSTQESRDAAQAGDSLVIYAKKQYKVKQNIDMFILHALIYGMGCIRVDWDFNLGEPVDVDKKSQDIVFEGDIKLRVVSPDYYSIYSTSDSLLDVYGYLEEVWLDLDEAEAIYPKFVGKFIVSDKLKKYDQLSNTFMDVHNKVCIYEYFEKKRPINANKGRHILFLEDKTVIKAEDNPFNDKELPIVLFADVVLPNSLYPASIVDLLREPQRELNELFSRILENVKLYSRIYLLVDKNANINKDALSDDPTIPVEYTSSEGGVPPRPMEPPSLPQFVFTAYDMLVQMMQHITGIREFSRGQMPKAVSGFTANLMIEADQKVFTQVHERYKESVKLIYEKILKLIQQYWVENRTINILDKENEVEAKAFKGIMLDGGFDVTIDYGTSLPIDPAQRRQMVQELATMFQQMGVKVDGTRFVELLKLGDVLGTFDIGKAAGARQRKEIKTMMESKQVLPIDFDAEDQAAHYTELWNFFQTSEYVNLEEEVKNIMKEHAAMHQEANKLQQQFPGMTLAQVQAAQAAQASITTPGVSPDATMSQDPMQAMPAEGAAPSDGTQVDPTQDLQAALTQQMAPTTQG